MKANIEIEFEPFTVPNFVICSERNHHGEEQSKFPLSALDSQSLDRLCEIFRDEVFKKAGKRRIGEKHGT